MFLRIGDKLTKQVETTNFRGLREVVFRFPRNLGFIKVTPYLVEKPQGPVALVSKFYCPTTPCPACVTHNAEVRINL